MLHLMVDEMTEVTIQTLRLEMIGQTEETWMKMSRYFHKTQSRATAF